MGKSKELAELGDVVTQDGGNMLVGTTGHFNYSGGTTEITVGTGGTGSSAGGAITFVSNNGATTLGYAGFQEAETQIGTMGSRPLKLTTDNTARLTIDASGRVTMPNQPAWVAYANSRTGWTTTGLQKTPYDSVLHAEPSSAYSTTNYRYTAPVAGRYWVQISQNGVSDIILYIYKNGSLYHGGEFRSNPTGSWEHYTIGTVVNLAANDYLEAYVNLGNSGGNAWNGGTSTWDQFSGFLIG